MTELSNERLSGMVDAVDRKMIAQGDRIGAALARDLLEVYDAYAGQRRRAPASLGFVRRALLRAEEYAGAYEFDSDEGCHTPSDLERLLMLDMLNGLFDDEEFVSALTKLQRPRATDDDTHRCFICQQPFQAGQMVLPDVNEGLGHRECFGEDREAYVKDMDTGEPLGPDDPIPAGEPYDPADYAPAQRSAPVVKSLGDWRRGYCDERVTIEQASTGFGSIYQVRVLDGVVWLDFPDQREAEFSSGVETAKAAAQADYERRILSALYTTEGG